MNQKKIKKTIQRMKERDKFKIKSNNYIPYKEQWRKLQ